MGNKQNTVAMVDYSCVNSTRGNC